MALFKSERIMIIVMVLGSFNGESYGCSLSVGQRRVLARKVLTFAEKQLVIIVIPADFQC